MHGGLRVGIKTEGLKIESRWEGLSNPELDAGRVEGGEEGVRQHPSTRMKAVEGEEGWAVVRVEGRDWGRVLGVGRLGGRVIACKFSVGRLAPWWICYGVGRILGVSDDANLDGGDRFLS